MRTRWRMMWWNRWRRRWSRSRWRRRWRSTWRWGKVASTSRSDITSVLNWNMIFLRFGHILLSRAIWWKKYSSEEEEEEEEAYRLPKQMPEHKHREAFFSFSFFVLIFVDPHYAVTVGKHGVGILSTLLVWMFDTFHGKYISGFLL